MVLSVQLEPDYAPASGLLTGLRAQPSDSLLALIGAYSADRRPSKIDVGVGVYRDECGATPVLRAVKAAEAKLLSSQSTKGYLGPEGDVGFVQRLSPIVMGDVDLGQRIIGLQTPGGTGALRLAAELIATAQPGARVHVGVPTWPNHLPILKAAGLEPVQYPYFDVTTQTLRFDAIMDAITRATAGDVVLLHGCCHNPLGADLDIAQWREVADVIARRGLVPLIDLAYQGLGCGLDEDAAGARLVIALADEALLAYSCDKNFGLYRERTGALFAIARDPHHTRVTNSNLHALARANWSMPPDHGAAVVRLILEDEALRTDWQDELDGMRRRIVGVREALAARHARFAPLLTQQGMFSTLPLSPEQVAALRDEHAIYMAGSGRINLAGLTLGTVPAFADATSAVLDQPTEDQA